MKRGLAFGLVGLVFVACGPDARAPRPPLVVASASATSLAPVPPPPPPREDGRLPPVARPLRYAIHLEIDPRKDAFTGSEQILLDVLEPTAHVVLDAHGEVVHHATLRVGNDTLELMTSMRPSHGALEPDEMVFSADRVVPKGRATLSIEWSAPFGKELDGLYRATDAGETYAFTQFEAADARRAFPCFDEPGYKTPFDVTLTVPTGMLALSNAPERSREAQGAETTFTYATTAPLPTYLVAFAVGHFDVVEGPKASEPLRAGAAGRAGPPIRFVTTRGRSAYAHNALRDAEAIVPLLAKYFGIAYPYDKLDLVAVPDFGAGGMENAGLITFRDDSVLIDDGATTRQKRSLAGLMTHELAHQWFGDLVTMKWWDDLWLNEGFATWAAYKIGEEYAPSLITKIDPAASATYIMDQDGLASAREIRQPVVSIGQAMEAFDGITYQKGAAVMRMVEHYVGEDVFQRGLHDYLQGHAFGNATADDLLGAIDAASPGKHASELARAYLDSPGVPVAVVDDVKCGRTATARGHEERFKPLGVSFGSSLVPWKVPLQLEPKSGAPALATWSTDDFTVSSPGPCPLFANPDAVGYYRVFWPEKDIGALMKNIGAASPATRLDALADAWAQTRAGKLDGGVLLRDVLPAFDRETEREVVERLVSILYELSDVVDDASRPAFAAYVRARVAPELARLERMPKLGESEHLLRRSLLGAAVLLGDDDALAHKLEGVAKKWAGGDKSIDADWGEVASEVSARFETPAALEHALESAPTPQAHALALRRQSFVVTPEAARAQLDWMLGPAVKLQDVRSILWPLASHPKTRKTTLAWVRAHWDDLRKKLPGRLSRGLVGMAGYACTPEDLDEARAFYTQKAAALEGAARPLSQALESASLCVALRGKLLPQLRSALVSSSAAGGPARR